jgi:hypothetical protein
MVTPATHSLEPLLILQLERTVQAWSQQGFSKGDTKGRLGRQS